MFLGLSIFIADLVGVALANHFTKRVNRLRLASQEVLKGNLDVHASLPVKKNCWELTDCNQTACPVRHERYPRCWHLKTEFATGNRGGDVVNAVDLKKCFACPVYHKNSGDELQQLADSFDAMTLSLKETIGQLAHVPGYPRGVGRKIPADFRGIDGPSLCGRPNRPDSRHQSGRSVGCWSAKRPLI